MEAVPWQSYMAIKEVGNWLRRWTLVRPPFWVTFTWWDFVKNLGLGSPMTRTRHWGLPLLLNILPGAKQHAPQAKIPVLNCLRGWEVVPLHEHEAQERVGPSWGDTAAQGWSRTSSKEDRDIRLEDWEGRVKWELLPGNETTDKNVAHLHQVKEAKDQTHANCPPT